MSTTRSTAASTPGRRREQILEAANALFAERGYDEVSIEDIASSAGVTRGSCTTTSGAARTSTARARSPDRGC